jgi:hypothetical protein
MATSAQPEQALMPGCTMFIIQSTWFEASDNPCVLRQDGFAGVRGGDDDVMVMLMEMMM